MSNEKSPGGQAGAPAKIHDYLCKANASSSSHPEFFYFHPDLPTSRTLVEAIAAHPGPWTVLLDDNGHGPGAFSSDMVKTLIAVCGRIVGVRPGAQLLEASSYDRVVMVKSEHHDQWFPVMEKMASETKRGCDVTRPGKVTQAKVH